jgi:hypothetical protein
VTDWVWTWDMSKTENLSWLTNYTTARTNLWLWSLATQSWTFSWTSSWINSWDQTSIVWITWTLAQFNTAITDVDIYSTTATNALLDTKANVSDLPSNINLFPTNANSDIWGYYKAVSSMSDVSYNVTAINIPTGNITWVEQLISSLSSDAWIIVWELWIITVPVIWNIRKVTWSWDATFHFHLYKRTSWGTETLLWTSWNTTIPLSAIYSQFNASALVNDWPFLITDRLVIKFYWTRIVWWSDPSYEFQFWWIDPVRIIVPAPVSAIAHNTLANVQGWLVGEKYHLSSAELTKLTNITWTNTWDETKATIESKLTGIITSHNHSWVYQPLATVLTNTTASYTTTIDTRLANTSWTNTWDQTSIVWITWTKAQFDTACSDWNFMYSWDTATTTNALQSATTTINVSSATAPSNWQVLTATSSTTATWQTPSGGGSWVTTADAYIANRIFL